MGIIEGEWDRPLNHARTLRERDGNDEPLAEDEDNDNNKYDKDGNIPNNDNEYAVGMTVSTSSLKRATTSMKLLTLPLRERALRVRHLVEVHCVTKSSNKGHMLGPHLVEVCSETKASNKGHVLDHIWSKSAA